MDAPRFQKQLNAGSIPEIDQLTSIWPGCHSLELGSVLSAAKILSSRRPWRCYSSWSRRPYQHKRSANHRREYARGGAQSKIVRFWGGNKDIPWEDWELVVGLKVSRQIQISSNALEAIRITINSSLQNKIGRSYFRLRIRPKPFQKIRENRMLAFAGADRVRN